MRLPNETPLSRIPTPLLIGGWLLAVVLAAACLFWALLSPNLGTPVAEATLTPTKTMRATVAAQPTVAATKVAAKPTATAAAQAKPTTAPAAQPTVAAQPTAAPTVKPTAAPAATTLPMNVTFGYGIQVNGLNDYDAPVASTDMVAKLGMTWIKQQVRWAEMEPERGKYNEDKLVILDRLIRRSNKANQKIMLSVVTAPKWSHPALSEDFAPPDDPQAFANFVGYLIDRAKKDQEGGFVIHAVEVWNEQNLSREWRTNPQKLDASRYMQLLRVTYQVVKSKDPNIIVISGALSPTGLDNGVDATDDLKYLEQMVANGLLNNADCIGIHHNGYNLPPDVLYQDAPKHAKAQTARFRGPFDNPHHSWSFRTTLQQSWEKVSGKKPLCVTEFGWASAEGVTFPVRAGFEFLNDNSLQDQAQYITQAFQLMKQWGFVKLAFLFNLNFNTAADISTSDNVPYSLLSSNGLPRPAFDALGAMAKP